MLISAATRAIRAPLSSVIGAYPVMK